MSRIPMGSQSTRRIPLAAFVKWLSLVIFVSTPKSHRDSLPPDSYDPAKRVENDYRTSANIPCRTVRLRQNLNRVHDCAMNRRWRNSAADGSLYSLVSEPRNNLGPLDLI